MAAAIIWIYGIRLDNILERRHKVRGRNSFAFSDLRHIITKAALSQDFDSGLAAACGVDIWQCAYLGSLAAACQVERGTGVCCFSV